MACPWPDGSQGSGTRTRIVTFLFLTFTPVFFSGFQSSELNSHPYVHGSSLWGIRMFRGDTGVNPRGIIHTACTAPIEFWAGSHLTVADSCASFTNRRSAPTSQRWPELLLESDCKAPGRRGRQKRTCCRKSVL